MKAALMAAVMAFVPGAALAHPNHHPHRHYGHDHTVIVEERDRSGDAAVILGGALVLGGLIINSQQPRVRRRTVAHHHHYNPHPVIVDEYWDHGRRYRVCQRGHRTYYC